MAALVGLSIGAGSFVPVWAEEARGIPELEYGLFFDGNSFEGGEELYGFVGSRTDLNGLGVPGDLYLGFSGLRDYDDDDGDERVSYFDAVVDLGFSPGFWLSAAGSLSKYEIGNLAPAEGHAIEVFAGLGLGDFGAFEGEVEIGYQRSSEDFVLVEDVIDDTFLEERYGTPGTDTFLLGFSLESSRLLAELDYTHESGFAGSHDEEVRNIFELTLTGYAPSGSETYAYTSAKLEFVDISDGSSTDLFSSVSVGAGGTLGSYYGTADAEVSFYDARGTGASTSDSRSFAFDATLDRSQGVWTDSWYFSYDDTRDFGQDSREQEYNLGMIVTVPTQNRFDLVFGADLYHYDGTFIGGDFRQTERSIFAGVDLSERMFGSKSSNARLMLTAEHLWNTERGTLVAGGKRDTREMAIGLKLVLLQGD